MIRSLDAATNRFLEHLRGLNSRLERAQREVAGGKRVAAPSDAPDRVVSLLGAKADLARLDQIQANLGRFKTEVDGAEGVLQQAVKLFDRVRTLGMTGASGIQTETTRRGIADEIQSLIERMTGIANTQVDGRYIFAGNADQTAPFLMDWSATPPWGPYRGAAATREAIHPTGVTFRVSLDAEWIFANPNPRLNVLAGMETLRQALLSGDEQAMQSALAPLADMAAHLNAALMFYGNVQTQIADGLETASAMKLRLQTQVASIEDADLTESIVELQQVRFTQEAALQVRAASPRRSLFDYLA
ncbi:MAG: flagellin [Bryobacteraceae bacterium]|nr:MAG: flagellin [Bryobacteraceae bacterium]